MTFESDGPQQKKSKSRVALLGIPAVLAIGALLIFNGRTTGTSGVSSITPAIRTAAAAGSESFSDAQKSAIEKIVKDYLLANPEIFIEIQGALEAKMEKEQSEKLKAAIAQNAKEIYRHPNAAIAGNPDGDITVVEFFDYNCGYCKRAFGDVAKLIEQDKNIRVVFADLPIIRDESEPVSRIALAARMQGKYWEVHRELITLKGLINDTAAFKVAEKAGLDMAKLKVDMNSAEVKGEIERIKELAKKMGINGTPHFLIGDRAVGGAPENLAELLGGHAAELRKAGCNYC